MAFAYGARRTLLMAACALASACSLVESFDGYVGGDEPADSATAPLRDAGADSGVDSGRGGVDGSQGRDAGSHDATADTAASDAAADSAPTGFCATKSPAPTFCDDFDTRALGVAWDSVFNQDGTPTRDTNANASPPDSLLVPVGALASGGAANVSVVKRFPLLASKPVHGEFGFKLRIDVADQVNGAAAVVGALQTETSSGNMGWSLQLVTQYSSGQMAFVVAEIEYGIDGGTLYHNVGIAPKFTYGSWHDVHVVFTMPVIGALPSGANSADVYFDGTKVATIGLNYPVLPYAPELFVGASYVDAPSAPWTIRYDDAWITITSP